MQGTNSEGKEIDSNQWFGTQGRNNIQQKQNEEIKIQKNKRLRNLWDNFKRSNIWIIRVPKGEEEEQEIESLFEKIM